MKLFGPTAELTEFAKLIMVEDINSLEHAVSNGFDINAPFEMTKYINEPPIILALCENKNKVVEWLISKNVNLINKDHPAILMACSNCDVKTVKLLIEHGANINSKARTGNTVMTDALYGNNYDVIPVLIQNGYNLKKDGTSLRQAVSDKQEKAIKLFLEYGIDVNYCEPDMVYPYNSTPVHVAANNNDIKTVKLLVQHGADVTIKDKYGERPYNSAVQNKNEEMMVFIKSLEPEQWHNTEQRLLDLKNYKIPDELLTILQSENRRINLPENKHVKFIEFASLLHVKKVNWMKHKFLDLLCDADNYSYEGFLVWYSKKKCIAFADYEHEEFKELCSVKEFFKNPSQQINKIFE